MKNIKKALCSIIILISFQDVFSQDPYEFSEYSKIKVEADSLYYNCKYEQALVYYRILNKKFYHRNHSHNMAACCIYLNYPADSAFKYIQNVHLSYDQLPHPAFRAIEKDRRWSKVLQTVIKQSTMKDNEIDSIKSRLIQMSITDHRYRLMLMDECHPVVNKEEISNMILKTDAVNFAELEMIINKIGWPTAEKVGELAAKSAFSIWNHAGFDNKNKYAALVETLIGEGAVNKIYYVWTDIETETKKSFDRFKSK